MIPRATAISTRSRLRERLVAALRQAPLATFAAASTLFVGACVPAANAPPAAGDPIPAGTTKPVSEPLGPPMKGNPTTGELCAAHTCPTGTYCDSDMTPRGPVAQCKPQIKQVPGRVFGAVAPCVAGAWA